MRKVFSGSGFILLHLVVICVLISFMGCEGEKGPTGPAGVSGTAQCGTCHNVTTTVLAKQAQWQASVHATGGNFARNYDDCATCHTSEGFREKLVTGATTVAAAIENPTPQNCRTCHNIHTNYDESDYNLATTAAVTLMISGDTVDIGKGNLCANCHQPRVPSPLPTVGGEDVTITSGYWGPHYGTQSAILIGSGGYELAGSVAYENSGHSTIITEGCPTCHMATPYGVQAGGHTMKMSYEYHGSDTPNTAGCESCHSGISSFDVNGVQTEIKGLLEELKAKLIAVGVLDATDHVVPGTLTSLHAGAVLNYILLLKDHSHGVHNAKYSKALLKNSIAALQ